MAHYEDLVYGIARRSSRCPSDAEDLAQDAFVRAYRALGDYEAARIRGLRLGGWLAAITLNLARNRARRREVPSSALEAVVEPLDTAPGPATLAEEREADAVWRRRLEALPTRFRRAVELRHVSGLSYPELVEALGRPVGTVKSDVHRGVRLLREMVEQEQAGAEREVER